MSVCGRDGATNTVLTAIVEDGQRLPAREVDRDVRDAWLIATAQRAEHLEAAGYGTVRTYAEMLGFTHAAQLIDEKLSRLAERFVNPRSIRSKRPI